MTHSEQLLFGERLRGRRKELGLTQNYVAEQAGITLRFYQMVERGEKCVSLDTLIHLSKALQISIDYLLFGGLSLPADNPLAETLSALSPVQREDAVKILTLYAKACDTPKSLFPFVVR